MRHVKTLVIVLLLAVSGRAGAQTKAQIKAILEQFCIENYDRHFAPRQYVEGTLTVTSIDVDEANNKIRVRGTHTCRGQHVPFIGRRTYSGREYKAELIPASIGIKVRFWRWYAPDVPGEDGHWEGPCEKTIIPDE